MGPDSRAPLLERARAGDPAAEGELLRVLQQFARHVCHRPASAGAPPEPEWEDVAQEAAGRLLRGGLAAFRPGGPERSFLYSIVKSARLQIRRGLVRRERREAASALAPASARDVERTTLLGRLLERLAPGCREILERSFFDGAPTADLAASMGMEESSVRAKLSRCLQRARALAGDGSAVRVLVGLLLTGGLLCASIALSAEPARTFERAVAEVDSLRWARRFEEARERARSLTTLSRAADPGASPCAARSRQLTARIVVASLDRILSLSPADRLELASADSAIFLVEAAMNSGVVEPALQAVERQLEVRTRLLGARSADVAFTLNDLGLLRQAARQFADAESLFRVSIEIRTEVFGPDHVVLGEAHENLGYLYVEASRPSEAETPLRRAVEIGRACLGPRDPLLARALGKLGSVLRGKGEYAEASRLLRDALEIHLAQGDPRRPEVQATHANLGISLRGEGRFAESERHAREALALARELYGPESADAAVGLNNLGALMNAQGDGVAAEPYLREALALQEKLRGVAHPSSAPILNQLGMALRQQGRHAEAETFYIRALELRRKSGGAKNRDLPISLTSLATALYAQKRYAEAEQLHRESLALSRELLGPEHPEVAISLHNVADTRARRGAYAEAESLYRESLALRRRVLGERHPHILRTLVSLAEQFAEQGLFDRAEPILVEASAIFEEARLRAAKGSTRVTSVTSPYPLLAACALERGDSDAAWTALERNLGRSLFDLIVQGEARHLSPADAAREDELRARLARWEARPASSLPDETARLEAQRELARAQADWSAWQQDLSERSPVTEGQAYDLARVQRALHADEAIVGWLDLAISGRDARAWGYVVRSDGPVRFAEIALAHPGAPDSLARALRRTISDAGASLLGAPNTATLSEARALYRERVAPLESALDGARRLIVVPAGSMLGVPVAALEGEEGEPLGDRFEISFSPSATVCAWLRENAAAPSAERARAARPALLVGAPVLAPALASVLTPSLAEAQAEPPATAKSEASVLPGGFQSVTAWNRSALDGDRRALASLPELPWSRREIETVSTRWPGSTVLVGTEATEARLEQLARARRLDDFGVIHFASHALVDDRRPERSAIVLSTPTDAEEEGTIPPEDGLLSAREIIRDWSLDADLVALSACRTGLGRAIAGEGYLGLAQAFLQRGGRCLLVSLWDVRDEATALLMERFYAHWTPGGSAAIPRMGKAAALRAAQRDLRELKDADGQARFTHPYYWAAFTLVGDGS